MRALLLWLWRFRAWVAGGLAALLVVDAIQACLPLLVRGAVDDLAAGRADRLGIFAGATLGIGAAMVGLRFLWRFFLFGAARRIRRDLRLDLHARLVRLDGGFRHGRSTGELMALASNDLDAVAQACGFGVMALFDAAFMILFSVGAMLALDTRLALIACLPLPVLAFFQWRAGTALYRRFDRVQDGFAALTEQVREALSGVRTVKAHAREAGCARSLEAANQANLQANLALARIDGIYEPVIGVLAGASMVLVLLFGGRAVLAGSISLGDFVALTAFIGMMIWPMMAIGWSINLWSRGLASMRRIQAVLDTRPAIADPADPLPLPAEPALELRAVTLRHPGAPRDALHEVSASIRAGGMLGVVGATAAGKSTLADLLVRLNDPTAGSVLYGGTDLRALRLADLRRAVGLVPQEPFVFALSVRDNLAFARPEATQPEVEAAARAACLHDEIGRLPQGYATPLGERGVTLSGGQRQRLAIARTLLADPALLVLDDCLSAIDARTESQVLANLRAARRGRTAVVISHRLRTVADADLILVLDHGRVAERGSHAELVAAGGLYARLHALQQAERAIEERG
jgi:ATP-binding cassette subfamily B protein